MKSIENLRIPKATEIPFSFNYRPFKIGDFEIIIPVLRNKESERMLSISVGDKLLCWFVDPDNVINEDTTRTEILEILCQKGLLGTAVSYLESYYYFKGCRYAKEDIKSNIQKAIASLGL